MLLQDKHLSMELKGKLFLITFRWGQTADRFLYCEPEYLYKDPRAAQRLLNSSFTDDLRAFQWRLPLHLNQTDDLYSIFTKVELGSDEDQIRDAPLEFEADRTLIVDTLIEHYNKVPEESTVYA